MDHETRELLQGARRDVEDSVQEIGDGVERLESGDTTESEALFGEALTRLRLLHDRIDHHLDQA